MVVGAVDLKGKIAIVTGGGSGALQEPDASRT